MWDIGYRGGTAHSLWRHYYAGVNSIIFVVDSSDRERIADEEEFSVSALAELTRLLAAPELLNCPILIFANKNDKNNSMSVKEIEEKLKLNLLKVRSYHVQSTCATTGDGLFEGLDWLTEELKRRNYSSANQSNTTEN